MTGFTYTISSLEDCHQLTCNLLKSGMHASHTLLILKSSHSTQKISIRLAWDLFMRNLQMTKSSSTISEILLIWLMALEIMRDRLSYLIIMRQLMMPIWLVLSSWVSLSIRKLKMLRINLKAGETRKLTRILRCQASLHQAKSILILSDISQLTGRMENSHLSIWTRWC